MARQRGLTHGACLRRLSRPSTAAPLVPLLLLLILLAVPLASAHANLATAEPSPNSRVDQAPDRLVLTFTEALSDAYTTVEMLDGNGTDHVRQVTIEPDGRKVLTAELGDVPDGVYSVKWRTLSQVDGHTRSGGYLLAMGVAIPGQGAGGTDGPAPGNASVGPASDGGETGLLEPVFRALGFAGASLAVGMPLFLLLTAGVDLPPRMRPRLDALAVAGAGTAALASLGLLAGLAGRTGLPLAEALATGPGRILALRAALFAAGALLLLGAACWDRRPGPRATLAGTGTLLSAAGLLATSLGGHAAAAAWPGLAVVNDWLHQVAVAFWIAGVVGLVVAAAGDASERAGAALVRRFSPAAVAAVVVIVVTGTTAAVDRLPALVDLWSTGYGLALLAKILLLVPLVALGAYHRYRVLPDLEVPGHRVRDFARLKWSAGAEVGLMVVVLVAAGILTSLSPPLPTGSGAGPQSGPVPQPYHTFTDSGLEVNVFLKPQPVSVGFQEMFVNVTATDDRGLNRSQLDAFLTLKPPGSRGGEASPQQGHFFHNETFHFGGALFTEPGNWTATLVIQGGQGDAFRYVQHDFQVEVRPAG